MDEDTETTAKKGAGSVNRYGMVFEVGAARVYLHLPLPVHAYVSDVWPNTRATKHFP